MRVAATSDLWWKNAVIYCLDVETYSDSDGDGVGDFAGLTTRLDHLRGLGVSCVWLMPYFPTPERDDGYDITDFYGVDSRLGTHGDHVVALRQAADRGLRVIADLVVNHTSVEHPWFQAARRDRNDPRRDWYVWSDTEPETAPGDVVFPDAEDSIWSYDDAAGQWYKHRFYKEQPDLNVDNPAVRDELARVAGFWLQQGLAGFRIDAVPYFLEAEGRDASGDPHDVMRDLRSFLGRRSGGTVLLGEVNLPRDQQRAFFGDEDGDELQMLFDFLANQAMYLSLARRDPAPLVEAITGRPVIPVECQWAVFVRNHDELTLDKLTDDERQEVFAAFGPDESQQLFGRGLRLRLPTMLGGDQRRMRMVYSLMFSLPGTPVLFYGEEIGLADNPEIPGRQAVRVPMQWDTGPNAGFSSAPSDRLVAPVATDPAFGPETVSVAVQRRAGDSLLTWFERLIRLRRETPAFGWGTWRRVDVGEPRVLAARVDWQDETLLVLHNFAADPACVTVPGELAGRRLEELFADDRYDDEDGQVDLGPDGYRWFRLTPA